MSRLPYTLDEPSPDDRRLWVMLHGFGWKRRFRARCRIHEFGVNALYVRANDWNRGKAYNVGETVAEVMKCEGYREAVFAGNSDGATWAHSYAKIAVEEFGIDVQCVVHYAGLWKGVVAPCPGLFLLGRHEVFNRISKATINAASAYAVEGNDYFLDTDVPGGHVWDAVNNAYIIMTVNRLIDPNPGVSNGEESTGAEESQDT